MKYEDIQLQARGSVIMSIVKKYPEKTPNEIISNMSVMDIFNLCEEVSRQSFEVGRGYEKQQNSEYNSEIIKEYLTQQLNSF